MKSTFFTYDKTLISIRAKVHLDSLTRLKVYLPKTAAKHGRFTA